jgi:hypothetical protein
VARYVLNFPDKFKLLAVFGILIRPDTDHYPEIFTESVLVLDPDPISRKMLTYNLAEKYFFSVKRVHLNNFSVYNLKITCFFVFPIDFLNYFPNLRARGDVGSSRSDLVLDPD